MENLKDELFENETFIINNYQEIEKEKEQEIINLMIEIIVSLTLKELYEEGD